MLQWSLLYRWLLKSISPTLTCPLISSHAFLISYSIIHKYPANYLKLNMSHSELGNFSQILALPSSFLVSISDNINFSVNLVWNFRIILGFSTLPPPPNFQSVAYFYHFYFNNISGIYSFFTSTSVSPSYLLPGLLGFSLLIYLSASKPYPLQPFPLVCLIYFTLW